MTVAALQVIDRGALPAIQARMQTIVEVMANVLEDGKDYGKIPGTDKPTLYKPGAEKLMLTFQLAAMDPITDILSSSDEVHYRMRVPIESADGRVVAVGVGEASSNEEKYRWRRPVCDEEFFETPEAMRREKWMRGRDGGKNFKVKQIRTSPADVANTILKMAHKRAFIHGTLLATAASGVFNQDLEDFTRELQESIIDADGQSAAPAKTVQRASSSGAARSAAPTADPGLLVTDARKVKGTRVFGKEKNNFAVTLEGDSNEYTTKNQASAQELEKFVGTDHLVRISYKSNEWQGKTYLNIENFVLADPVGRERDAAIANAMPMPGGEAPSARDIFGNK